MMKKVLCFALSVMMLLLPVFSQAEGMIEKAAELIEKGSEVTVTSQFIPGDTLLQSVGDEKTAAALKDLFNSGKLEVSFQSVEDLVQAGARLLLGDTKAIEILFSKNPDELLLSADLLSDDVYAISKDELIAVIQGGMTGATEQEISASVAMIEQMFSGKSEKNPLGGKITSLVTDTLMQLMAIVESNVTDTEGETLLMDGSETGKGSAVTITKEQINTLAGDFAKKLAEIPEYQELLKNLSYTGDRPEELLTRLAACMRDVSIRFYVNGENVTVVSEYGFDGEENGHVTVRTESLVTVKDRDMVIDSYTLLTDAEGTELVIRGSVTAGTNRIAFKETINQVADGKSELLAKTDGNFALSTAGDYSGVYGIMNFSAPQTQTELKLELSGSGKYTEDSLNYSQKASVYMTPDMSQPLFTLDQKFEIGLAEAYLTGDNAVRILQMTEEEQQKLTEDWETNMLMKLITLLPLLPESLQNLVLNSLM